MKIKNILIALSVLSFASCDYLDIVPDEQTTEFNTYETPAAAKKYLYSCYAFIPNSRASDSLDKMTGGEIVCADEKTEWAAFPRGYYSPSSPSLAKAAWENPYLGIRQCWQFLSVVDKTPNITQEDLNYYKAEAHLLIAYYHWLILRAFGPAIIMDKAYDAYTPYGDYPERSTYDKCVEFIDGEITEALKGLSTERVFDNGTDYGRLTKYCALALRSRMYLYAASPLFNGNTKLYSDFKNSVGEPLISQTYDSEKWKKAAEVALDAITQMEDAGFRLYDQTDVGTKATATIPGIDNPYERAARFTFVDNSNGVNPEIIWADTRAEGTYAISNQSTPYQQWITAGNKNSWNLIAPSLNTIELFYTENGLPMDKDPDFDYPHRYDLTTIDLNGNFKRYADYSAGNNNKEYKLQDGQTIKLNAGRENRFYAWIAFHNGPFEISKYAGKAIAGTRRYIKMEMMYKQNNGWDGRQSNYSLSGYLNKKCVSPLYQSGPGQDPYPYPVFRLAEIYLNYAEALIETQDPSNFETARKYINKVRTRSGVPTIEEAWAKAKNEYKNLPDTYKGLQEIVRQERQIEFYMENQRFWDLRRWMQAESLGEKPKGMNIRGTTAEEFHQVTTLSVIRSFSDANYLMPIPIGETNKVPQIKQNPGYIN